MFLYLTQNKNEYQRCFERFGQSLNAYDTSDEESSNDEALSDDNRTLPDAYNKKEEKHEQTIIIQPCFDDSVEPVQPPQAI